MSRIDITADTIESLFIKMSDGNPGALNAMLSMGPKSPAEALPYYLMLDEYGIYGTDIYVLFVDICDRNVLKMKAVLMGVHVGLLKKEILADAAHRQDYSGKSMIPVDEIYELIKLQFKNFG